MICMACYVVRYEMYVCYVILYFFDNEDRYPIQYDIKSLLL
jgi:hypothetical protein